MKTTQEDKGYKQINRTFSGEIDLGFDLTHYLTYTVSTNIAVSLKSNPVIGGSAEIKMVGDGTHSPVFSSDFTKSKNSEDYDTTSGKINKVVFYHDGTETYYSITVLN